MFTPILRWRSLRVVPGCSSARHFNKSSWSCFTENTDGCILTLHLFFYVRGICTCLCMCAGVCVHVCVRTHTHTYVEARARCHCFPLRWSTLSFEAHSLTEPGAHSLTGQTGWSSCDDNSCLWPRPGVIDNHAWLFTWDLGVHTWMLTNKHSATEPSPQPLFSQCNN